VEDFMTSVKYSSPMLNFEIVGDNNYRATAIFQGDNADEKLMPLLSCLLDFITKVANAHGFTSEEMLETIKKAMALRGEEGSP
jgi:hypothetical protein